MAENSSGIEVKFSWEGFAVMMLHVREAICGEFPIGEMQLHHSMSQDELNKITDQKFGKVEIIDTKEGGLSYTLNIFITKRNFVNNLLSLEFICIPGNDKNGNDVREKGKNFYTATGTETYDDIFDAIEDIYPGIVDYGSDSLPNQNVKIYREASTGAEFISRLGFSYKKDTIFAYSWGGLIFRDISNIDKIDRDSLPKAMGNSDSDGWQTKATSLKYDTDSNYGTFNPWRNENADDPDSLDVSVTKGVDYSELEPKNVTTSMNRTEYRIFMKDYDVLDKNATENRRFAKSKGTSMVKLVTQNIPKKYKLGDKVLYKRQDENDAETDYMVYLVAGNELFFSQNGATKSGPHGFPFEWTVTLWGLEKLPVNEEKQDKEEI